MPELFENIWKKPWKESERVISGVIEEMRRTAQNPEWHAEGDVLKHTQMVCEAMLQTETFCSSDEKLKQILYLSALLHDIGKIKATRLEDGVLVSPGHARIGAEMARRILWQEFGLCGTAEKQQMREAICNLIANHSLPPHAIEKSNGKFRLMRAAANGELTPYFNIKMLCCLALADINGRISADKEEFAEKVILCEELAKEAGCYEKPYSFPSDYTAFSYLSGKNISPEYPLYDATWGEVILMSGLPGTGKDTWIKQNCPQLPMISLDEIRKEYGISPVGPQMQVANIASERAKEMLRKKQSFVWNATNITPDIRQRHIKLFCDYGAFVRAVYLETDLQEQMKRNKNRADAVPERAIDDMLRKLIPPERFEAHRVDWICL